MPTTMRRCLFTGASVLTLALTGCAGQTEGQGGAAPTSAGSGSAGATELMEALADPGDDLLDGIRRGVVFTGTDVEVSWRFPEAYEFGSAEQTSLETPDGSWDVAVSSRPGQGREERAQEFVDDADPDVVTEVVEVEVRGVPFSLVTQEADGVAAHVLLWSPPEDDVTVAVVLYGPPPLAETPSERLTEFAQVVGSLEYGDQPLADV